jgi:hypothetical protein
MYDRAWHWDWDLIKIETDCGLYDLGEADRGRA